MEESHSIWPLLIVLVYIPVLAYPVVRILNRAGYSSWWAIIAFIPIANLIGLWVFSFAPWPGAHEHKDEGHH